jgi:hypothetical protein
LGSKGGAPAGDPCKVPRAAHKGGERTLGYKGTKGEKQIPRPSGLVMTTYKREERFFDCASRPEIIKRDFRGKAAGRSAQNDDGAGDRASGISAYNSAEFLGCAKPG